MEETEMNHDSLTQLFARLAYKLHPELGKLYESHSRFFNDQFVELIGLIIANVFVIFLSYYFIGIALALVLLVLSTPVTLIVKYELRKHWVWVRHDS